MIEQLGPGFEDVLQQLADETGRPLKSVREEAEADLKEMAVRPGHYSVTAWNRFCAWLARAYQLDYSREELAELRRLNKTTSLIFLPNHRSYLDPLVLRSALMAEGFPPNNVMSGANLAMWPLSAVGQRNGVVFIRREFRDDQIYRAVLRAYLASLIKERKNLEWYFEGGRTRTGKLREPKGGVLSYVMDAFERYPENDVRVVPTAIVYDQQHEVGAISAEEMGGKKKAESLSWLYKFAKSQSRRLGRAYLRFGEPLSLHDAVALTADENGLLRPRLAVSKVAFETANRINAVTPITPGALITYALLDSGGRAITIDEGREVLSPLVRYVHVRGLPTTEIIDLGRYGQLQDALERMISEQVVSSFSGGHGTVYWVELDRQHEAAFYRNTIIHFFVARAITELATLEAAEHGAEDIKGAVWQNAKRLKELLMYEFFFPSTREFAGEVAYEVDLISPDWQTDTFTAEGVLRRIQGLDLILAHRVIGPILEAYSILASELAGKGELAADPKKLVELCLGVARQRWLQSTLPTAESISRDYFLNCVKVAARLDLLDGGAPDLAERRRAFADELLHLVEELDKLRRIAQAAGQPIMTERAPVNQER